LLLKEREQTFDRISSVQESFAKDNAEVRKLIDANKAGLVRDLEAFKVSNDQRLTTMNTKLTALDTSMKKALDVMMTLAARAGYADVQAAVLEAAQPLNYIPQTIPEVRPAITEIQHFFLAPSLANNTDACTGATAMSGAGVRTYYQHGGWGVCWVNFRNYPLGEWFGRANNMFYRVFGAASEIRMDTQGFTKSFRIAGQPSAGATIKAGKPTQGVFDLSGDGVLTWYLNYNRSWDGVVINFTALSDSGKPSVTSGYRVQLYSPLVLDFVSVGMPRSISVNDSEARFDLQANGSVTRHGWIAGDEAGFLALDREGTRTIRDGSQLFGDATRLSDGSKASNGYQALAQYDANKDGFIDRQDPVYSKLVVWFDRDADGVSASGEVKTLAETGVQRIAVKYQDVAEQSQIQAGNRFKYQAKFWGPSQCPTTGCNSYDVYFSTSTRFMASKQ